MKKTIVIIVALVTLPLAICSFASVGWKMDYGKPAAQFHTEQVAAEGEAFVGRKITIKGTVEKVDTADPKSASVTLAGGIRCDFGKFKAMAEANAVGDVVYVDGILRTCEQGDVVVSPALYRDPKAPFEPAE